MRISIFVFVVVLLISSISLGQKNGFGAGVMLGEPTGLSAKYWLEKNNALDFGLAYSFVPEKNKISLHADYLFHINDVKVADHKLPMYYGFGARLRFSENSRGSFGARGVVGALYYIKHLPIDVFLEVVPVFQLLPKTALNFDLAIGARYYFY